MTKRSLASLLLAVASLAACTSKAPSPRSARPALAGTLVALTATPASSSVVAYPLSGSAVRSVDVHVDPEAVNRSTIAGSVGAHGALFVVANHRDTRAFSLASGAGEAVPVSARLAVRSGEEPLLSVSQAGAVAVTCDGAWTLRLPGPGRWTPVNARCWAALSPDGRYVAYTPDGRRVLVGRAGGGRPHLLFDLDVVARSLDSRGSRPSLIGTPAWGPDGLAFMVRAGDQFAVYIALPSGALLEVLQERYINTFRVPRLAWRPTGRLLAIADDVGPSGAVLRVYDVSTRRLEAVSLAPVGYAGIAWAPDGTSIASLTGAGDLVVVSLRGTWLATRETDWDDLLGWSEG